MTKCNDTTEANNQPATDDSDLFVELERDGDQIEGVFCGAPHGRELVLTDHGLETFDPSEPSHRGKWSRLCIALNFYVLESGVMRILEGQPQWFRQVCEMRREYGLKQWAYKIERTPAPYGGGSIYQVQRGRRLDLDTQATIRLAVTHDLDEVFARRAAPTKATASTGASATTSRCAERLQVVAEQCLVGYLRERLPTTRPSVLEGLGRLNPVDRRHLIEGLIDLVGGHSRRLH